MILSKFYENHHPWSLSGELDEYWKSIRPSTVASDTNTPQCANRRSAANYHPRQQEDSPRFPSTTASSSSGSNTWSRGEFIANEFSPTGFSPFQYNSSSPPDGSEDSGSSTDNSCDSIYPGRPDLYKSELCHMFVEGGPGACKFGSKCKYAHGAAELRVRARPNGYRTKPCNNFHCNGLCFFKVRCDYIHETVEDCERRTKQCLSWLEKILIKLYVGDSCSRTDDSRSMSSFTDDSTSSSLSGCLLYDE